MTDTDARTEALRILYELMAMGDDLFIHLDDEAQEAVGEQYRQLMDEIYQRLIASCALNMIDGPDPTVSRWAQIEDEIQAILTQPLALDAMTHAITARTQAHMVSSTTERAALLGLLEAICQTLKGPMRGDAS